MPVPPSERVAAPPTGTGLAADLARARAAVHEAELADRPGERYLAAHAAALRCAAVVLVLRSHPATAAQRRRPQNPWQLLTVVAPEFAEWAAYFSATRGKQQAVRAGATGLVSPREADDLVRDAQTFLGLVERAVHRSVATARSAGSRES
jgi:hypothetical protein